PDSEPPVVDDRTDSASPTSFSGLSDGDRTMTSVPQGASPGLETDTHYGTRQGRFTMSTGSNPHRMRMHALAAATAAALSTMVAGPAFAPGGGLVNTAGLQSEASNDRFIIKYKDGSAPTTNAAALNRSLNAAASATLHGKALGLKRLRRTALGSEVLVTEKKLGRSDAEALMRQLA